MSTPNKTTEQTRVQGLIAGTTKHFQNVASLTFGGTTITPAALIQLLQSFLTLVVAVNSAKAAYKVALGTERDKLPSLRAVIQAYKVWVLATFGDQPDVLQDFSLSPRKVAAPKTAEQKAQAAAKRRATRAARHTMSAKQKKVIHGQVPAPADGGSPSPAPAVSPNAVAAGGAPASPGNGSGHA